jgi:hypothetical protein
VAEKESDYSHGMQLQESYIIFSMIYVFHLEYTVKPTSIYPTSRDVTAAIIWCKDRRIALYAQLWR